MPLLNRDSHVEADRFDNVPSVQVREELDDVIHIEEARKAVKDMKCNKASGGDGKNCEEVPQELKDASIVTIVKKGCRTECGNYHGISLISVAGKILAKILS